MPKKKSSSSTQRNKHQSTDDVCVLCETKSYSSVHDFWMNGISLQQKLNLLQVDKTFVLKQIRSSNLYSPNFTKKIQTTTTTTTTSSNSTSSKTNSSSSSSTSEIDGNKLNDKNNQQQQQQQQQKQQQNAAAAARKSIFNSANANTNKSSTTCLCPACKKRKAIFNVVVKGMLLYYI
jgi:DNA polymerase III alpha subunit (gram-positive type)